MSSQTSLITKRSALSHYWWLPAAFFGPFLLVLSPDRLLPVPLAQSFAPLLLPSWSHMGGHALMLALRSGIVGISLACIVYVLWKLDCRYNHDLKLDRNAKRLVLLLGVMLWTVWFCNCQIVMIASEEAKNFAYNQDFEP